MLEETLNKLKGKGRQPKEEEPSIGMPPPVHTPQPTVKVKVVQPDNVKKDPDAETANIKLANTITNPTDAQLPSLTWLSRPMANWTATQNMMSTRNVFSDETLPVTCPHCGEKFLVSLGYTDLPEIWEKNLYRRNMSIDNTHADRIGELARMQIVGGPDDEPMNFGATQ